MFRLHLSVCSPSLTPSPYPHILVTIKQKCTYYVTNGFYQLRGKNFQQMASEGYKREVPSPFFPCYDSANIFKVHWFVTFISSVTIKASIKFLQHCRHDVWRSLNPCFKRLSFQNKWYLWSDICFCIETGHHLTSKLALYPRSF